MGHLFHIDDVYGAGDGSHGAKYISGIYHQTAHVRGIAKHARTRQADQGADGDETGDLFLYTKRLITGHTRKLRVVKKEALTDVVYFTPTMLKMYIAVIKMLSMKENFRVSMLKFLKCLKKQMASTAAARANLMDII